MARVVNEQEFKARRSQILEVTRKLIYSIGYEQMSIQDILEELKMSKGAFYHYFGSKPALLEALIEHMMVEAEQLTMPILQSQVLTPLEKLRRWFDVSTAWKTAQKDYLLALVRIWYTDDNAILRQKMFSNEFKLLTPHLTAILREGIRLGQFTTPYPQQAAEILFYMFQALGDRISESLLEFETQTAPDQRDRILIVIRTSIEAYSDAIERVIGAPAGSLLILDTASVSTWFTGSNDPKV